MAKEFEYQYGKVTRCKENTHIMPALNEFGADGWEVFNIDTYEDYYGVWMRREIEPPPAEPETSS